MNLCRSCGRDFASLGAFDAHRRGDVDRERRCLTLVELAGAGLELDRRGRWRIAADARRALARYGPSAEMPASAPGVRQDAPRALDLTPEHPEPSEALWLNPRSARAQASVCSDCRSAASPLLGYCAACGTFAIDCERAAA